MLLLFHPTHNGLKMGKNSANFFFVKTTEKCLKFLVLVCLAKEYYSNTYYTYKQSWKNSTYIYGIFPTLDFYSLKKKEMEIQYFFLQKKMHFLYIFLAHCTFIQQLLRQPNHLGNPEKCK